MSVSITFEPSGISGVVAEGTYLIDAARRMGAPLGAGCTAGKGECPACVVSMNNWRGITLATERRRREATRRRTVGAGFAPGVSGQDREPR